MASLLLLDAYDPVTKTLDLDQLTVSGGLSVSGNISQTAAQSVGFMGATPAAQQTHIADATGGATVDAEARVAINAALAVLETFGFVATS